MAILRCVGFSYIYFHILKGFCFAAFLLIYEKSYTLEDGHVVKDSENQNTIKLHADGNITCNNY
jgi:hypothetical protein